MFDLTGNIYGRLTVVRKVESGKDHICRWLCHCECGKDVVVKSIHLTRGITRSCGCLSDDTRAAVHAMNLTGTVFGRLTALYPTDKRVNSNIVWHCKCSCGKECDVTQYHLTSGTTKSCGCLRRELHIARRLKWDTPEKRSLISKYENMMSRCYNPNVRSYKHYGGRGIYVCDEWRNSKEAFVDWGLASGYREGLTIDRIDDNGPYSPSNCRWANIQQQCENRRTNVFLTVDGVTDTITSWARKTGSCHSTLSGKLKQGKEAAEKFIKDKLSKKSLEVEVANLVLPWDKASAVLPDVASELPF